MLTYFGYFRYLNFSNYTSFILVYIKSNFELTKFRFENVVQNKTCI